jgi:hypothetical protein
VGANLDMRYFWIILNWMLVALAFLDGYSSVAPDKLRHTNPDSAACLFILLATPLFAIWMVTYSTRRWKFDTLSRPSWSRNPLKWSRDPLQSLFISTCVMAATAIGGAVKHPALRSVGFWMLGVYSSFAIGLLVGQILVYRIYRQRIAPAR